MTFILYLLSFIENIIEVVGLRHCVPYPTYLN